MLAIQVSNDDSSGTRTQYLSKKLEKCTSCKARDSKTFKKEVIEYHILKEDPEIQEMSMSF